MHIRTGSEKNSWEEKEEEEEKFDPTTGDEQGDRKDEDRPGKK